MKILSLTDKNRIPPKGGKVCSLRFQEPDFKPQTKYRRLHLTACPDPNLLTDVYPIVDNNTSHCKLFEHLPDMEAINHDHCYTWNSEEA